MTIRRLWSSILNVFCSAIPISSSERVWISNFLMQLGVHVLCPRKGSRLSRLKLILLDSSVKFRCPCSSPLTLITFVCADRAPSYWRQPSNITAVSVESEFAGHPCIKSCYSDLLA
jgi:hypothetical protein